ncbi:MAG: hypothetical protein CVV27_06910, partial [Candidatus Melainabacteria bacterium HGW-Melainabacteria-1]
VTTGDSGLFYDSLETSPSHSGSFWAAFHQSAPNLAMPAPSISLSGLTATATTLENLHRQAYKLYRLKAGNHQADVEVSIVPLTTSISGRSDADLHRRTGSSFANHTDLLKVRILTYVPSVMHPQWTGKVEAIVHRPVIRIDRSGVALSHALLAESNIDLQNFNTSSGDCAAGSGGASCIDLTTQGDVHSNGNLTIGANGYVQGKATATGIVDVHGTALPATDYSYGSGDADPRNDAHVTDRISDAAHSRSQLTSFPIPEIDSDTSGVDAIPCTDLDPDPNRIRYADCRITGNLNIGNNDYVEYQGTVHISGDLRVNGSQRCGGSEPCRIVVDGTATVSGNGSSNYNSSQEAIYIVKGNGANSGDTCLDIGGTPDAEGSFGSLFFVDNPLCNTQVRGNSDFFGGIITRGSVETLGNASNYGIQRDANMDSLQIYFLPVPAPKNLLMPELVIWKELR